MIGLALMFLCLAGTGSDPEELSSRALQLARQLRFDEAEKMWKQALELSPRLFSAAFNLGYMLQSKNLFDKAEPYLRTAAAVQPADFNSRYLLGVTLSRLGRGEEALQHWRAALKARPDHVKLMQIMTIEYGKLLYFGEAATLADRVLALTAYVPEPYLIAIRAHQDANDHPAALAIALRFVQRFPSLPRANFEYAYELNRAGRAVEGLPFLKKAMESDGRYEEPFFLYGEMLAREAKWSEAAAAFRRAIELRSDYPAARLALGKALMSARKYDEARSELLRAAQLNPTHPQPHLLLSQLYFRLGQEELSAKEKQLSLQLRREHPDLMESPQSRPYP